MEIRGRLRETDLPASPLPDSLEQLVRGWALREPGQFSAQVLLQRLPSVLGAILQGSVNVIGEISYEDVRHAFILQAVT